MSTINKRRRVNDTVKRQNEVVQAALKAAETHGYTALKRKHICAYSDVSVSLVSYYFNPITTLKKAVAKLAVEKGSLNVVSAALTAGDLTLEDIPMSLRASLAKIYL